MIQIPRGVALGLPVRRNSLMGRFKKRYVSGMTGQIRIPLEAARIQELAYLCDLEEMRRAGRIVCSVSVGVSKAERTSDVRARAPCSYRGRSARISNHLEGAGRE